MNSEASNRRKQLSRRDVLKSMGFAPLLLRPAPFFFSGLGGRLPEVGGAVASDDLRLRPHYPAQTPLADLLRLVAPGSDEYVTEKYAAEIDALLRDLARALKTTPGDDTVLTALVDEWIESTPLGSGKMTPVRSGMGIEIARRKYDAGTITGRDRFAQQFDQWLGQLASVEVAEFEIYGVEQLAASPLALRLLIRYDMVATRPDKTREERVGAWKTEWVKAGDKWTARKWEAASDETLSVVDGPAFVDVTQQAMGAVESYPKQMLKGVDHWRTVLDGAVGMDIYGNNGVAAGDFDNDGFDDFYVAQPAGLPNRLYRNRGDGTFEDVTEKAGVGVLDNTACALFADFENNGLQDLLVVCGTGPLLFQNQGNGTFKIKRDAFKFAQQPQGTFTHAAIADYDRDGRLDVYFCTYMYYLGLDQYHYPLPYYDARNGPPNCLMRNMGGGNFVETTQAAGLNAENNRYSFACAWGESQNNGLPDLFVVNDFGSSQLYRNNGDGTFKLASAEAHVEDVGAGMSCCWADYDNDGHQDVYVPSMWEAAGQRVSMQMQFHAGATEKIRGLYQRHARGNALYRNQGDGSFKNVGHEAAVEMGRWSWSSDFWDFDHDGFADLYVANGYISAPDREDLAGFFWRQVVAKSSDDATPSQAYERGWNAINELIRGDKTWHGYARNVMFANNRDGSFTEISGPTGLDFTEDSRSFALADIDHDGRLEVILKNRNAPQLKILHNTMKQIGNSICFRLRGHKSNRDGIGAAITVEAGALKQVKFLQAGTGFLAQHSKEVFFGLGATEGDASPAAITATVRWPSGITQRFSALPVNHRIEIEEGLETFTSKPFATAPASWAQAGPAVAAESLPKQAETWLIEPLKAPEFSLPDVNGKVSAFSALRGGFTLLNFWSGASELCRDQLQLLDHHKPLFSTYNLLVVAVNVDEGANQAAARSFAALEAFNFAVLFATDEVAGVYNILYRHLFDRRRDLAIPTSFLINREGMIVKVYQGAVDADHIMEDLKSIPATPAARLKKALPFAGDSYQPNPTRNAFTYGVAFFQHGYLEQAAEAFRAAIVARPYDPEAYYNLGTLNLRRNNFAEAQKNLELTLKLKPNYPEAWNNLGMMAAQQGQVDEAIRDFQQSLQLRPNYEIAWLNLGNLYRRQGAFDKAAESLRHALDLQPDDAEIVYSLGMLSAQQNQTQAAEEFLKKAIRLRPEYAEAMNNLGVLYVKEQEYARAEEQFKQCMARVPGFDQSYLNLAKLHVAQGDKAGARGVLTGLLDKQPQNKAALQALAALQ